MNTRQFVLRETGMLALGELLCAGATVGIFALSGYYTTAVLLGAIIGTVLAVGNFFLMAVAAEAAADKAMNEDVKGGKATVKTSMQLRLIGLFALLALFIKTGLCNPIAIVVPLLLVRPVLMVVEFFRKAGENQK
ncbi:MAG: hypothetical protein IJ030_02250 [Oscillospiraceae bacterium]|nr:hypothetical protein [Oscillospiraceae bacterium]